MIAAALAAGLCLVVGMVALVAATGGSGHAKASASHPPGTGDRSGGSQLTPPAGPSGKPGPAGGPGGPRNHARTSPHNFQISRTLRHYQGRGAGEPGPFVIRKPGIWGLFWSYSCPRGELGDFVLGETHSWIGLAVTIKESGASGTGTYWVLADAGRHSLVVASECSWRLRVVLPVPGT